VSLTLAVLAMGPRRTLNHLFSLFTLTVAVWAASALAMMMMSWLEVGSPALALEVATLAFALLGPLLLLFAARYVNRRSRWTDLSAVLGLAALAALAIPLFDHQLVLNPRLAEDGLVHFEFSAWGYLAALLLAAFFIWSCVLFWRERRQAGGWYFAISVLLLLLGMTLGAIVQPWFPLMSITTPISMAVLCYGIINRQLLNPLQELTARLEDKVEERTKELEEAYKKVERAYAEVEGWVDERTAELRQEIAERKRVEAERADLLSVLRHRSTQLQTAIEVSQSASVILDPDELITQAVHLIRDRFDFYYVGMFLLDETGEYATLRAGTGEAFEKMRKAGHKLKVGSSSMVGWCTEQGKARVAQNVGEEDVRFVNPLLPDTRSELALPLISRGQCIGALTVQSAKEHAFSADDVDVLQTMVDQIAVAIENARLLEAERRRGAELEALRQASLHVTSILELQPVLDAIIEHALKLVSADNAHIFLYDGETLTFGAAVWAGGPQQEPYAEPRENGLTYTVAQLGERIVVGDVDVHPLFQDRRWGGSVAGFPLQVGDEVRGVMNIAFERPHVFTDSELNVLELLADQAAIAVHNARMHEQVRAHAEELAAALAQQEELDRLKGEFVQNVSHELRSPLALIRGYAEMLSSDELGELQPDQLHPISVIARRAQMLSELVEDITLILGAETRPQVWESVALDEVSRTAVEEFRMAADQANLTLRAEIAEVPRVKGSLTYLRRVLDNLLSNAIKFTPDGGTITVSVWSDTDQVSLQVKDTGIGIPADQLDRIFERFYQVDGSARRRYGGVGLGLALVRELAELHGGRVEVTSEVDKGSCFTVTLPAVAEA
jgi:signal transduction histidine kinase